MDPIKDLNGKTLLAIIDFDFIVNTEIGLVRFIRDNFMDDRVFNLDILNKRDRDILFLLYIRNLKNPLSVISNEENMGDIDKLYDSFFSNYEKEIINNSIIDDSILRFSRLVSQSDISAGVSVKFLVHTDEQEALIRKLIPDSVITRNSDLSYDSFYVKDYSYFTKFNMNKIKLKSIYTLRFDYNIKYLFDNQISKYNKIYLMGFNPHEEDEKETT